MPRQVPAKAIIQADPRRGELPAAGDLAETKSKRDLFAAMTSCAERWIAIGWTQAGADILAFLSLQPDADAALAERAEDLLAELETWVCPRVLLDARDFAADMDLQTMLEHLRDILAREPT